MSFAEQYRIAIDALVQNQNKIFEFGKKSVRIITFQVCDVDGVWTEHNAIEGMTFRELSESVFSCGSFSIDGDKVLHNAHELYATTADDVIVEDGMYEEMRGFYIGSKEYFGCDIGLTFEAWVNSEYNTAGFYIENGFLRTADGKYVSYSDPNNTCWQILVTKRDDVCGEDWYTYMIFENYVVINKNGYDNNVGIGESGSVSTWSDVLPFYWEDLVICSGTQLSVTSWTSDEEHPLLYNDVPVKPEDPIVFGGRYVVEPWEES